ncbi:hypothetical protein LEN26_015115 [Aphanomyces euteiches]|nr:hypothetical protein LEN26_015115 [Aphanomyces euteiches]KAH9106668.1 hypothetical protein AeMF1_017808 [Aphanomyces euteiches]KAH9183500.1 hypothetical protein AeNC1_014519 [Aphanomyces euteiches]
MTKNMPRQSQLDPLRCVVCRQDVPIYVCNVFPYAVKSANWKCFPCSLSSSYRDAWDHLKTTVSATIANTATIFDVKRAELTRLARWYHILDSTGSASQSRSTTASPNPPLYTKEQLAYAVQYAKDKKSGCRQASRAAELKFRLPLNTIPHATVHQHVKDPRRRGKPGAQLKLPVFEEALIAQQWILRQETQGVFLTQLQAAEELIVHLKQRNRPNPFANGRPSNSFWRGFLRRHPSIRFQSARPAP